MMFSDTRLLRLSIEAFRGFRDRREFDLDASAVIVTGPNGTGKTSFFDALQWVFLGSIERLEGLRARKNVEHVVSRYRTGERARVELSIFVDGGEVTIARTGDYRESTLEVRGTQSGTLFGQAAENWVGQSLSPADPGSLGMALTTCGLLQQDVMRSVLEAKPADRYAHISTVLGLRDLEAFEDAARIASKEATDQSKLAEQEAQKGRQAVEAAAATVELLQQRAQMRVPVEVARSDLESVVADLPTSVLFSLPSALTVEIVADLARSGRQLQRAVEELARRAAALTDSERALSPAPEASSVEALTYALASATSAVESAEQQVAHTQEILSAALQQSEEIARLAAAALPMLTEHCPVCGQAIDPAVVSARLQSIASDSSTLVRLRDAMEAAVRDLDRARSERSSIQSDLDRALDGVRRWDAIHKLRTDLEEELSSAQKSADGRIELDGLNLDSLSVQSPVVTSALDNLATGLERFGQLLRESQSSGEIDRARAEFSSATESASERQQHALRVSRRAARLKQLADAAAKARVDVTKERFEAIEPLVSDIYSRLDPHPAFKMIGFEHDTYYGKGASSPVVRDLVAGVNADPLIVFSASQANIAALSYFLAMSLGAGDRALPFVLLDDPLQSMDDVNVLGFADLCRFLRAERQLMLSTHDRRFANLLRRKLAPRGPGSRTIVHEFTGWDRRGPSVETEILEDDLGAGQLRLLSLPA